MKMTWQPSEEGLLQIIQLLKESQSPDTNIQHAVQQVRIILSSLVSYSKFNSNLTSHLSMSGLHYE